LAAQDLTNLNRFIEQTINITESLLDVDFALYAKYNHAPTQSQQNQINIIQNDILTWDNNSGIDGI